MFCTQCGTQLEEGTKFCTSCGAQTVSSQGASDAAEARAAGVAAEAPAKAAVPAQAPQTADVSQTPAQTAVQQPVEQPVDQAAVVQSFDQVPAAQPLEQAPAAPSPNASKNRLPLIIGIVAVVVIIVGVAIAFFSCSEPEKSLISTNNHVIRASYGSAGKVKIGPDTLIKPHDIDGKPMEEYQVKATLLSSSSSENAPAVGTTTTFRAKGTNGFTFRNVKENMPAGNYMITIAPVKKGSSESEAILGPEQVLPVLTLVNTVSDGSSNQGDAELPEELEVGSTWADSGPVEGNGESDANEANNESTTGEFVEVEGEVVDSAELMFYGKLCEYLELYGKPTYQLDAYDRYYQTGLVCAQLIDFDKDGSEELYVVYNDTPDPGDSFDESQFYTTEVWLYKDGELSLAHFGHANSYQDGTVKIEYYDQGNRVVLREGEDCEFVLSTLIDGEFGPIGTYELQSTGGGWIKKDGKEITSEQLAAEIPYENCEYLYLNPFSADECNRNADILMQTFDTLAERLTETYEMPFANPLGLDSAAENQQAEQVVHTDGETVTLVGTIVKEESLENSTNPDLLVIQLDEPQSFKLALSGADPNPTTFGDVMLLQIVPAVDDPDVMSEEDVQAYVGNKVVITGIPCGIREGFEPGELSELADIYIWPHSIEIQ